MCLPRQIYMRACGIVLNMSLYLHEDPDSVLFYFLEVTLLEFLQPNPVALKGKTHYHEVKVLY